MILKKNYERASGTYWKEPYAGITGGYKVEVFKEGYLPNDIFVYIKENDQTFKEAFRNLKSPAKHGPQTSYTGKRKLTISPDRCRSKPRPCPGRPCQPR